MFLLWFCLGYLCSIFVIFFISVGCCNWWRKKKKKALKALLVVVHNLVRKMKLQLLFLCFLIILLSSVLFVLVWIYCTWLWRNFFQGPILIHKYPYRKIAVHYNVGMLASWQQPVNATSWLEDTLNGLVYPKRTFCPFGTHLDVAWGFVDQQSFSDFLIRITVFCHRQRQNTVLLPRGFSLKMYRPTRLELSNNSTYLILSFCGTCNTLHLGWKSALDELPLFKLWLLLLKKSLF